MAKATTEHQVTKQRGKQRNGQLARVRQRDGHLTPVQQKGERKAEPKSQAQPLDALEMLEAQHREAEGLLRALIKRPRGRELRQSFSKLAEMLLLHDAIETRYLYPLVRAARPDLAADVLRYLDEHRDVKRVLGVLFDTSPSDQDLLPQLEQLAGLLEDHVMEEEHELFPRVRELMDREQLLGIAQEMLATMAELQQRGDRGASTMARTEHPAPA